MGHSLGAGVAAIITFLLRAHYPQLSPKITCLSYCPPGGLLNREQADINASPASQLTISQMSGLSCRI